MRSKMIVVVFAVGCGKDDVLSDRDNLWAGFCYRRLEYWRIRYSLCRAVFLVQWKSPKNGALLTNS